jgi:hypothetical protein
MTTPFIATHEITFTPANGTTRTFTVALVEGAADMTDSRFCGTTEASEGDVNILSWPLPLGFL